MSNVVPLKSTKEIGDHAPRDIRSRQDTVVITKDGLENWNRPATQRPLKVNAKVLAVAEDLKTNGGVLPGVLTYAQVGNKLYLIDGQHRVKAFELSGLEECYADIRIITLNNMAEIGQEFIKLNSNLVTMKPDDKLRALEPSSKALQLLRNTCPFVGYDNIRRGDKASPLLSMTTVVRCWTGSLQDIPNTSTAGSSALGMAEILDEKSAMECAQFLNIAFEAWGRDLEYHRLWGQLNLILCMWLWRRTVTGSYSAKSDRVTAQQFTKCLMSLSADAGYIDWLLGRNSGERDRGPAYSKIKVIFAKRLETERGKKVSLPAPAWSTKASGSR